MLEKVSSGVQLLKLHGSVNWLGDGIRLYIPHPDRTVDRGAPSWNEVKTIVR